MSETEHQQALFFLTTEHGTLQSARGATISESNGRVSIFLGIVSSGLIALGFVGRDDAQTFFVFCGLLFPLLLLLGIVTFERMIQLSIEDIFYARSINRIRRFYLDLVPAAAPYLAMSASDDVQGAFDNMAARLDRTQLLFTSAGLVSVVNSTLAAVFTGLMLNWAGTSAVLATVIGVFVWAAGFVLGQTYQLRQMLRAGARVQVNFPSQAESKES